MNVVLARLKAFASQPTTVRGMLCMLVAAGAFTVANVGIRALSAEIHVFEIAFFRSLFGFIVLAPAFLRHGLTPLKTQRPGLHALRGCINVGAMLAHFSALALVPLATFTALTFMTPLFVSLLAIAFLGEPARIQRIAALVAGLAGALVILRPGVIAVDLGAGLALLGSALVAAALIDVKVLSRTDSGLTITLYLGLFTTPLCFLAALPFWTMPTVVELGWMFGIGALGSLAHIAIAQAFKDADAVAVMPVNVPSLIWASLLGYAVLGEIPDIWAWIGGTLIFAAATWLGFKERRRGGPAA